MTPAARATERRLRLRRKRETFEVYGGAFCVGCGSTDLEALSLDHVNGGGHKARRALGMGLGGGKRWRGEIVSTTKARKRLGRSMKGVELALHALEAEGLISKAFVGRKHVGWTAVSQAAA